MILTQEQEMIRDSMRAFAQERLAPFAAEWDKTHAFPAEALKELGELGAMGMCVPEEWGGAGMDYMSLVLTLEEIAPVTAPRRPSSRCRTRWPAVSPRNTVLTRRRKNG